DTTQTPEGRPGSRTSSPRETQAPATSRVDVASNRGSTSPHTARPSLEEKHQKANSKSSIETEPLSKILLRCCGCGYFHDVPNRIYDKIRAGLEESQEEKDKAKHVRCPWCRHVLGVECCTGHVAVVQLKERLH